MKNLPHYELFRLSILESAEDREKFDRHAYTEQNRKESALNFGSIETTRSQDNRGRCWVMSSSPHFSACMDEPELSSSRPLDSVEDLKNIDSYLAYGNASSSFKRQKLNLREEKIIDRHSDEANEESKHNEEGSESFSWSKPAANVEKTSAIHRFNDHAGVRQLTLGGHSLRLQRDANSGKISVTENGMRPDFLDMKCIGSNRISKNLICQSHLKFLYLMADDKFTEPDTIATYGEIEKETNLKSQSIKGVVSDLCKIFGPPCFTNIWGKGFRIHAAFENPLPEERNCVIAGRVLEVRRDAKGKFSVLENGEQPDFMNLQCMKQGFSRSLIRQPHLKLLFLLADKQRQGQNFASYDEIKKEANLVGSNLNLILTELRKALEENCTLSAKDKGVTFKS